MNSRALAAARLRPPSMYAEMGSMRCDGPMTPTRPFDPLPRSLRLGECVTALVDVIGLLAREVDTPGDGRCGTGRPDGRLTNDDTNTYGRRAANRIVECASDGDTGDHRGLAGESMRRRRKSTACTAEAVRLGLRAGSKLQRRAVPVRSKQPSSCFRRYPASARPLAA
uniref:Uncharacterized protein n=1 Tax=Plectus sambesii TaxID=2011161 RepID=A0A914VJB7_9BILA